MALFIALYFRVCLFGRSVFGVEMEVKQGSFVLADSLLKSFEAGLAHAFYRFKGVEQQVARLWTYAADVVELAV